MFQMEKASHITALKRQLVVNRKAAEKKVRFVGDKLETYKATPRENGLEAALARIEAVAEIIANAKPGQMIEGHGIFFGIVEIEDKEGTGLKKSFNAFAAPEDLTDEEGKKAFYTYTDTIARVVSLKDWHGFDGADCKTAEDIYAALRDGGYGGGWIIPPSELLAGRNAAGSLVRTDNLFIYKNTGALKDTFATVAVPSLSFFPDWYWSSTEAHNQDAFVRSAQFSNPTNSIDNKDKRPLGCRLIRLEPRP